MFKNRFLDPAPPAAAGSGGSSSAAPGSPASAPAASTGFGGDQGPDLLSEAAPVEAPAAAGPAQAGQPNATEQPAPAATAATTDGQQPPPAAAADPDAAVMKYLDELGTDGQPEDTATTQLEVQSPAPDAFKKLAALAPEQFAQAMAAVGITDANEAKQIQNAIQLVGRQGEELGSLRKESQTFKTARTDLQPVLEIDPATGEYKGFKGIPLLKMATDKFGVQEVQNQLATEDLQLVRKSEYEKLLKGISPTADPTDAIAIEVAKSHQLYADGMDANEILTVINANPRATFDMNRRITKAELDASQAGQRTAQQKQQADQQRSEATSRAVAELAKRVPDFDKVEPVMTKLYDVYKQAQESPQALVRLLHLAAEGMLAGTRFKPLLESRTKSIEAAVYKRLGITPEQVTQSASQPGAPRVSRFSEDVGEVGADLIGAGVS